MARPRKAATPKNLNGIWYLVRYVPLEVAHLDSRKKVVLSTGIRVVADPRAIAARAAVAKLDEDLSLYWRDLAAGRPVEMAKRSKEAAAIAGRFGVPYLENSALVAGPMEELVQRLFLIQNLQGKQFTQSGVGVLGKEPAPKSTIMVSELVDRYEQLQSLVLKNKSDEQRARWRSQRDQILKWFVASIGGDKPIVDVTEGDVDTYRDGLREKALREKIAVGTANKRIGTIAAMFRAVNDDKKLKLLDLFGGKRIKGGGDKVRAAFSPEYVQNVILKDGVMDGLNDEAKAIFYMVAETGMRPSEVAGLCRATIFLDVEIPHVKVLGMGRTLKTKNSARDVPLAGVALEVMRRFPNGFPHYRTRTNSLSTTINKFMKENKLTEGCGGQTFYSLRHTFKDRLVAATPDAELRDYLMGHALGKERYGSGHLLKQKYEVMKKIAFKAPRLTFGVSAGRAQPDRPSRLLRQQPQGAGKWRCKRDLHPADALPRSKRA